MGMTIPERYGGQGASWLDVVGVVEEIAKACTLTARIVVESNMGAVSAIMAYGTHEQCALAARYVLAGDKPAICITEPNAGSAGDRDDNHRPGAWAAASSSMATSTGSPVGGYRSFI